MQQQIDTLVVAGVGLIGGSFALALKRAGRVRRVIGVGRTLANLERALALGVVDEISQDIAAAAPRADLVLLASPVGQMGALMAALAPGLRPGAIVTDGGSTKSDVAALYRRHLPDHLPWCVPAHPIAGSDMSGAVAAQYGLYENRRVVLTPLAETAPEAAETVAALWRACGAEIHSMSAAEHDAVFASVSHLPHLLAFAYVDRVAAKDNAERCFDFAATGFRDFTRIAGSHPEMWTDISLANRDALLAELADYRAGLERLSAMLAGGDAAGLQQLFSEARGVRTRWHQQFLRRG
ncbi:prephenate dehydrogenase/arogenate dehydrogenase family protein [Chromobacterium subtsugae]|uniref:Prephenate dehydrogenase/arogenate dehydrogenase family protein n=1 Tax=Chromobacterium subtsugae TaxID=251747 RepID=A0ABS7FA72_9NEIS|nr:MULTISPECIES: prephenate dehydrogenase/arogenate dehydrogenase family protein [Chromobacterium]KUM04514.1 prephenate dehydrogenase [Chromobacterium subtsugae]KZE87083.1 prephenate dehydrogenase [Chromobacterium sp. F49]MBW7565977.1 prephenate dehydrogenase/arogenate dehydrogenase family protein [Chromobacterium subtsugae]MBW8286983.1 prephenate dehydrogenase/arogenate dehydrogenase family protein [Chromobacterium subtsugae]OBU88242.1 prephenate dehydrogenase [Chromobacterium subtsugae]